MIMMRAREPAESHRAATPLELFFDLCFVVAVSPAAAQLHHALTEHHVGAGLLGYLMVFFAIWWAWMNFTWFASAYDTDDPAYRVTTLVQMAGALVLATGVPAGFDRQDFLVITLGYVIMRLAMVAQWLRAGAGDPARRGTTLRYAIGIGVVQFGWVLRLLLPGVWGLVGFAVLALAEMAVPVWAERRGTTTWHSGHIAERYGCFTLIVLGEVVLGATTVLQQVSTHGGQLVPLLTLSTAGIVIVFGMWWLYFDQPAHDLLTSLSMALRWGYGHYAVFGSVAAVGAGLEIAVDYDSGLTTLSGPAAGLATAVPVAIFLIMVWLLHVLPRRADAGWLRTAFPVVAVLILLTPLTPAPIHLIAGLLALLVIAKVLHHRHIPTNPIGVA